MRIRIAIRRLAAALDDVLTIIGRAIVTIILTGTALAIVPQARPIPILVVLTLAQRLESWFITWPGNTPNNLATALQAMPLYPLALMALSIAIYLLMEAFRRRA